jgi:hypothetical protein
MGCLTSVLSHATPKRGELDLAPALHAAVPTPCHSLRQVAAELGISPMSAYRQAGESRPGLRAHRAHIGADGAGGGIAHHPPGHGLLASHRCAAALAPCTFPALLIPRGCLMPCGSTRSGVCGWRRPPLPAIASFIERSEAAAEAACGSRSRKAMDREWGLPSWPRRREPSSNSGSHHGSLPDQGPAMDIARLFQSGHSQAVRLPKEYRFSGNRWW